MQLTDSQRTAALALGLDPNTLAGPMDVEPDLAGAQPRRCLEPDVFGDEEWLAISATGALPLEAAQAGTTPLRVFVGAVVSVVCNARSWTELAPEIGEATRRRFGRFAASGIWQSLAAALTPSDCLSATRVSQFTAVARRAESLRSRQR